MIFKETMITNITVSKHISIWDSFVYYVFDICVVSLALSIFLFCIDVKQMIQPKLIQPRDRAQKTRLKKMNSLASLVISARRLDSDANVDLAYLCVCHKT